MNILALRKKATFLPLTIILALFAGQSPAAIFENYPDVIVCNASVGTSPGLSGDVVFYLDARYDDGRVRYKALGLPVLQLTVDSNGVIAEGPKECAGKTLEEIEKEGRALHLFTGEAL